MLFQVWSIFKIQIVCPVEQAVILFQNFYTHLEKSTLYLRYTDFHVHS